MKKIIVLMLILFASSANATVILNNFSISESNISFNVMGTVSQKGTRYQHQLMFGLVDNNDNWINNFNRTASTFAEGSTNSRSLSSLYNLSGFWTDSLLTVGNTWQVGDIIDIAFNFAGSFNIANFDLNNFGMSVGLNTGGNIVPSELNLVTSINGQIASAPEPSSLILFGVGIFGVVFFRKRYSI